MSNFTNTLLALLPLIIWIAVALWGMYVQPRSIKRSAMLLERAQNLNLNQQGPVVLRLKNDHLLYRIRFFTVANNLLLGLLSVFNILHVVTFGHAYGTSTWLGIYGIAVVVWNEASLNWLSWRDEKIQEKIDNFYTQHPTTLTALVEKSWETKEDDE